MSFKPMKHSDGRDVPFTHDELAGFCRGRGIHPAQPPESMAKAKYWEILCAHMENVTMPDGSIRLASAADVLLDAYYGKRPIPSGQVPQPAPQPDPDARDYPMSKRAMVAFCQANGIALGDYARLSITDVWSRIVTAGKETEARLAAAQPGEPAKVPSAVSAPVPTDAAAKLADALQGLLRPAVDADQVRAIVAEEVAKQEARVVYVVRKGAAEHKLPDGEYVRPEAADIIKLCDQGLNVLLVGPTGCGKSHLVAQIARMTNTEFGAQSCSAGMSESALAGWLLPVGERGAFAYVSSVFVRLYENGGTFCLDEVDASDANLLVFMNQALSNGGFFIPQRHENPWISRHENFRLIATANTYGHGADRQYVGRAQLDAATLDRFWVVSLDYDRAFERKACKPEVLEWANTLRKAVAANKLRRPVSTRKLVEMSRLLASESFTFDQCKGYFFEGWSADERAKVGA